MLQSLISPFYSSKLKLWYQEGLSEKKYPRMDQVKLVEDSIKKFEIWNSYADHITSARNTSITIAESAVTLTGLSGWTEKKENSSEKMKFSGKFFFLSTLPALFYSTKHWLVYEWFPGNFVQSNECKRDFNHELSKMCVQMSWWSTPIMMLTSLQ